MRKSVLVPDNPNNFQLSNNKIEDELGSHGEGGWVDGWGLDPMI